MAWHIAALSRAKKLPKLDSLLIKQKKPQQRKKQSWQDMYRAAEAFAETLPV